LTDALGHYQHIGQEMSELLGCWGPSAFAYGDVATLSTATHLQGAKVTLSFEEHLDLCVQALIEDRNSAEIVLTRLAALEQDVLQRGMRILPLTAPEAEPEGKKIQRVSSQCLALYLVAIKHARQYAKNGDVQDVVHAISLSRQATDVVRSVKKAAADRIAALLATVTP